ncbi:hypothetical protein RCL1_008568 [Eukaryota sp. TZLM3-RCL]
MQRFVHSQKCESFLLKSLISIFGNRDEIVIAMGDQCGGGKKNLRHQRPTRGYRWNSFLKRNGFEVYLVDETLTSKRCPLCQNEVKNFLDVQNPRVYKRIKYPLTTCWGLVGCESDVCKADVRPVDPVEVNPNRPRHYYLRRFWNRNRLACLNILNIVDSVVNGQDRPLIVGTRLSHLPTLCDLILFSSHVSLNDISCTSAINISSLSLNTSEPIVDASIFPILRQLSVENSTKLEKITFKALESLLVSNCKSLRTIIGPKDCSNLTRIVINSCPELCELSPGFSTASLSSLELGKCRLECRKAFSNQIKFIRTLKLSHEAVRLLSKSLVLNHLTYLSVSMFSTSFQLEFGSFPRLRQFKVIGVTNSLSLNFLKHSPHLRVLDVCMCSLSGVHVINDLFELERLSFNCAEFDPSLIHFRTSLKYVSLAGSRPVANSLAASLLKQLLPHAVVVV